MSLFLSAVENDVFTDVFGSFDANTQFKLSSKAYLSNWFTPKMSLLYR